MNRVALNHLKEAQVCLQAAHETSVPTRAPVYTSTALTHAIMALCHVLDGTLDVTVSMGNGEPIRVGQS